MCLFCKIVAGEIPSSKVYENDKVLAFLDIKPVSSGHTLVIPKTHYSNLEEIGKDELQILILAVKKVGQILKSKLNVLGYNILVNNDPIAGQEIPHLHFHIIPRQTNDNLKHWSQREYELGEMENILKKLTS